jgi:hypothetical protein
MPIPHVTEHGKYSPTAQEYVIGRRVELGIKCSSMMLNANSVA